MSLRATNSQFVRLDWPVTDWLTVQRWDSRKAPESPNLRVTNTFSGSGRYDSSEKKSRSSCQNQHFGAKWVYVWGGGIGCCELAYFLTKSFLRSADSQRGWWCQEPQWRPPARVRAALCSQQYLISLRGKFGQLVVEVGRHMTWAAVPAVAMLSTDLSDYVCLLLMKWDLN